MGNKPVTSVASLAGWVATAAAVAIIPVLLITERDRSPYFWYRVLWAEFLTLVVWIYFSGFIWSVLPGGRKRAGTGGLLPVSGFVIGIYTLLSFILMILCDWPSRFHWAGQVVLLVLIVLLFVSFEYARAGAVAGTEPLPAGLRTPAELCAMIRLQEEKLWSSAASPPLAGEGRGLHDSLKTLREAIGNSLQHVGRIGSSQDYGVFVADTERLCSELQVAETNSAETKRWRATAEDLRRRVDFISVVLKVRPS